MSREDVIAFHCALIGSYRDGETTSQSKPILNTTVCDPITSNSDSWRYAFSSDYRFSNLSRPAQYRSLMIGASMRSQVCAVRPEGFAAEKKSLRIIAANRDKQTHRVTPAGVHHALCGFRFSTDISLDGCSFYFGH